MINFNKIGNVDVAALLNEVLSQPDAWDKNPCRLSKRGPHHESQDIILRYKDETPGYADPKKWVEFGDEHIPVWYKSIDSFPSSLKLVFDLMAAVRGEMLGCVMIYKVQPGKQVFPHIDRSWHADYYDKFNICLQSNPKAAFQYKGDPMPQQAGDVHHFRNDVTHWVTNEGDCDHVVLTVCIRLDKGYRVPFAPEGWSFDKQMEEVCQQHG